MAAPWTRARVQDVSHLPDVRAQVQAADLPAAVLPLKPVEKLVWLYISDHPGDYSGAALSEALGVSSGRALASLIELGLLVQEVAPTNRTPGKYRAFVLSIWR